MRRPVAASLLLAVLTMVPHEAAAADFYVVARNSATYYPGGADRPDPLVITQGSNLWFQNFDLTQPHDVTEGRWDDGRDPLFASDPARNWNLSQGWSPVPVYRVERLMPGIYEFYCEVHPGQMEGVLIVV